MVDPNDYIEHETLKDGTKVTVRAIRPKDAPSILEAFGKLDRESVYRRFFSLKKELSASELKQLKGTLSGVWQYDLPSGYRLWYRVDSDAQMVSVIYIGPHP